MKCTIIIQWSPTSWMDTPQQCTVFRLLPIMLTRLVCLFCSISNIILISTGFKKSDCLLRNLFAWTLKGGGEFLQKTPGGWPLPLTVRSSCDQLLFGAGRTLGIPTPTSSPTSCNCIAFGPLGCFEGSIVLLCSCLWTAEGSSHKCFPGWVQFLLHFVLLGSLEGASYLPLYHDPNSHR